jgi:hypothetical protein
MKLIINLIFILFLGFSYTWTQETDPTTQNIAEDINQSIQQDVENGNDEDDDDDDDDDDFRFHSFYAGYTYIGEVETELPGNRGVDSFSVSTGELEYSFLYPVSSDLTFSIGGAWQYIVFDNVADRTPLPDQLYGLSLELGFDWRINENWGVRLSVSPGIYSDFEDLSGDDFNMPGNIGVYYVVDQDLIFFFGAEIDVVDEDPIIPVIGVRWNINEDWTLDMLSDSPRMIYHYSDNVDIYGAVGIEDGTFRVRKDFGRRNGIEDLDNTWLSYFEIHLGVGVEVEIYDALEMMMEVGYMPSRSIEFEEEESLDSEEGGIYGRLAIELEF